MRMRQLESYIAACELGSISRAAEKLHIAQPALGLQIRGLEDDMGMQLLERHPRGVQPTEAGKVVLEWARETVRSKAHLKERLRLLAAGVSGRLTLGLTPSVAAAFAVAILVAAHEELPSLRLQLAEVRNRVLLESMQAGRMEVDLALVFDAPGSPPDADCLLSERLFFVAANDGGLASSDPIPLVDVIEHPLAIPASGDSLRQCVEHGLKAAGAQVRIKYEVQSSSVVLSLVRNGLACTILPLAIASDGVREGWLSARPISGPVLTRNLRWLRSTASANQQLVRSMQRLVAKTIRRHVSSGPLKDAYVVIDAL